MLNEQFKETLNPLSVMPLPVLISDEEIKKLGRQFRPVTRSSSGLLHFVHTEGMNPRLASLNRDLKIDPRPATVRKRPVATIRTRHHVGNFPGVFKPTLEEHLAAMQALPPKIKRRVVAFEIPNVPLTQEGEYHIAVTRLYAAVS